MIADFLKAMTVDRMIVVYLALVVVCVLAILYQFVDMGWYAYRMRRANRYSRRIVRFGDRRKKPRHWLMALLVLNLMDRYVDLRERWRAWRQGDQVVGDRLIGRIGKLR